MPSARIVPRGLLPLLALLPLLPLASQEPHRAILRDKLRADLEAIAEDFDGVLGAQIVDLTDSTTVGVNQRLVFPQGSAIKIPILIEVFRQAERRPGMLQERRPVTRAAQVGGSGVIQYFGDGSSTLSLEDLAVLMITLSDNTATNVLIDAVGMNAINQTLADMGFRETRLQRKMIQPEASLRGEENLSTPAEAAEVMTRLARCDLPVGQASCRRITEILEIPKGGAVREPVPGSVRIAFKPGTLEGVATVWAYVELPDRPYVVVVMTNYGGNGDEAIRMVSEVAYGYFAKLARATPHGTRVPPPVIRRRP
ncbi:MAG TPA: serine hydrolase [Gemmatimonadales bacterium]|uniref:beta-lactamase n=1 Tax=uncultured Gemmatimonadetes bacterium Rifle_16ft_4_minimus_1650 TaxID=1665094 RepID=A0A0H4T164_9BACT|nr:beta-lactamase, beta-lactamase [uncultured Gemmatimonadetes bacterium Rifle_16ft_4_minimus_1650]HLB38341.1 serine hydrolase [Gemmatimonadales bacterium]